MSSTRRRFLGAVCSGVVGALAGCAGSSRDLVVDGRVATRNAPVDGATVTAESGSDSTYARLLTSDDDASAAHWETVAELDSELASACTDVDYDTHFIALAGIALSPDLALERVETKFGQQGLYERFVIERLDEPTDQPRVFNYLGKWSLGSESPPEGIELNWNFNRETSGDRLD